MSANDIFSTFESISLQGKKGNEEKEYLPIELDEKEKGLIDAAKELTNLVAETKDAGTAIDNLNKLKSINIATHLSKDIKSNAIRNKLIDSLMRDLDEGKLSQEKQFRLLDLLDEDARSSREILFSNQGQNGGNSGFNLTINTGNQQPSVTENNENGNMKTVNDFVDNKVFQKAGVGDLEGILESVKIISNSLKEEIKKEEKVVIENVEVVEEKK